jgi:hypothetical protein
MATVIRQLCSGTRLQTLFVAYLMRQLDLALIIRDSVDFLFCKAKCIDGASFLDLRHESIVSYRMAARR